VVIEATLGGYLRGDLAPSVVLRAATGSLNKGRTTPMEIATAARATIVGLLLAGAVGISAAHAGSAATAGQGYPAAGSASTARQPLALTDVTNTATTTTGGTTTRTDLTVSPAEASHIAALVGHGRVTKSDEELTPTGLAYEMTVVRPDGSERKVTVDRGSGRVLANTPERLPETREVTDGRGSRSSGS
jgi:hypothetical protein